MGKSLTGYPSIDKPWLKYYVREQTPENAGKTVYQMLRERNQEHLLKIALEYFGRKTTYQELFQQIEMVKAAFEDAGVKEGGQVAFFTSSTPETVYGVLALCRIGAVANMVNPLFEAGQIHDRIEETRAEIVVVLDQLYSKFQNAVKECGVLTSVKKLLLCL